MAKRTDRPIRLWWTGATQDGRLALVLWIEAHGRTSWCARLVSPLPAVALALDVREFASGLMGARNRLLAQLRMGWRKAVLPADYANQRRQRYIARREAEIQAEHERLLGLNPAQRVMQIEIESYKARWP